MYGLNREYWERLLPLLPHWLGLTVPQRAAALALPPGYQPPHPAFSGAPAALDSFCFDTDNSGRKRPTPAFQSLIGCVRRLGAWSLPKGLDMQAYVHATTTTAQRHAMTGTQIGSRSEWATQAFVRRLRQGASGRALIECAGPAPFIRAMGGWVPGGDDFGTAKFGMLKKWFSGIIRNGDAAFALDAGIFGNPDGPSDPADLLHLALGFGLAVVYRRQDDFLPCFLAIAPKAVFEHKPENVVLKAAEAGNPFRRPFLLDDIETWLRELKARPAPVLSDGWNVPLAHQRKVAKGFLSLPAWLPASGFTAEDRAGASLWIILKLELAVSSGDGRKDWRLGTGPKGEAWLARPREEKLAAILEAVPLGRRAKHSEYEALAFLGDFAATPFPYAAATSLLFAWLDRAFADLRGPSDWRTFFASAAEKANPFICESERDPALDGRWAAWETSPEKVYASLLHRYAGRLAGLGALGFAEGGAGHPAVFPTEIGDWLYGRAGKWSLPEVRKGVAVVGADFTVALLEKSLEAGVELSAFAESEGNVFRITKKSVQAAVHAGHTAGGMVAALEALSKHVLPANVAHEIREWAANKRSVKVQEAILVEGEDPLALAELRAAFPRDFAAVSPLALKYLGKGTREALMRRLAKKGFFTG